MPEIVNFDLYRPTPLMIVISGPSGVGKDAVVKAMKARNLNFHFVVTAASRAPRPGEMHGVDYFFVTRDEFEQMIAADELLEHAQVYGEYKGIPKNQIRQALASGKDVVLRVDVQGAATLRKMCPDAVLIFLVPPNDQDWVRRLVERKVGADENLILRREMVKKELEYLPIFDYLVVNPQDNLDVCVDTIVSIIDAEHHRAQPRRITL